MGCEGQSKEKALINFKNADVTLVELNRKEDFVQVNCNRERERLNSTPLKQEVGMVLSE